MYAYGNLLGANDRHDILLSSVVVTRLAYAFQRQPNHLRRIEKTENQPKTQTHPRAI